MATPDPLAAVSPDVASRTKNLLAAVASGGSQGLRAYEQSEAALRQAKTDAVARAQQRASLIGGPEAQGFEAAAAGQFDRRLGDVANSRGSFESHMAGLGAAHKNYLSQVSAAVPLVRADTERQLALKKLELEEKNREEMSADALLGLASQMSKAPAQPLRKGSTTEERNDIATAEINRQLAGHGDQDKLTALAAELGGLVGAPEKTIAEMYSPSKQSSLLNAQQNMAPETPADVKNIANWANVDNDAATKIADDPTYRKVRDYGFAWADPSAYSLDDDGLLTDEGEQYDGKTPWEAFLADLAGVSGPSRTALINEFGPLFSQLGLK